MRAKTRLESATPYALRYVFNRVSMHYNSCKKGLAQYPRIFVKDIPTFAWSNFEV